MTDATTSNKRLSRHLSCRAEVVQAKLLTWWLLGLTRHVALCISRDVLRDTPPLRGCRRCLVAGRERTSQWKIRVKLPR